MPENIEEKIYYEDQKVKVTNLRLIFRHDTIPIPKISFVDVNLGVTRLAISFIAVLISLGSFYYIKAWVIPAVVITSILLRWAYENYVELWVSFGQRRVKVITSSMTGREYIYQIADSLSDAIADSENQREVGGFDLTETIQLKELLQLIEKQEMQQGEGGGQQE